MTTLTETVIDLADQHTSLYHIDPASGRAGTASLPLGSEQRYCQLMRSIFDAPADYAVVCDRPGTMLARLSPGFADNKYWRRIMPNSSFGTYADDAWRRLLPVEAQTKVRISFVRQAGWAFQVLPRLRVLLHPFGWSTWVSLRILEAHTVEELADVIEHVFQDRCLQPGDHEQPWSLDRLFDQVGEGVRSDAFGGRLAREVAAPDASAVTTVLAKHGGSPALGALSAEGERTMLRLVRPDRRLPSRAFDKHVRQLAPGNQLEYLLAEDRKRFLWVEHLLRPVERNRAWLRCYHNNTFHALVRASHLQGLLDAVGHRSLSSDGEQLVEAAIEALTAPRYRNASLIDFVQDESVQRSIRTAQQRDRHGPAGC